MRDHFKSSKFYDTVLFESENFIALPSLGSIIPGWLLIVPKTFKLSFSELSASFLEEAEYFVDSIKSMASERFGSDFVCFEHGPTKIDSSTGCTIDYAHLHFVPINKDSFYFNVKESQNYLWRSISGLQELATSTDNSMDYLYFSLPDGVSFISQSTNFPSQFFRKVIAKSVGMETSYNWKEYPYRDNILETIRAYK